MMVLIGTIINKNSAMVDNVNDLSTIAELNISMVKYNIIKENK